MNPNDRADEAAEQITDLSDFRMVNGMSVAFKRKVTVGVEEAEITLL